MSLPLMQDRGEQLSKKLWRLTGLRKLYAQSSLLPLPYHVGGAWRADIMSHFQLPQLADDTVDLLINTNSLSEMDYVTVEEYLTQIGPTCNYFFRHENSDRDVLTTGDHKEVPVSHPPTISKKFISTIHRGKGVPGASESISISGANLETPERQT